MSTKRKEYLTCTSNTVKSTFNKPAKYQIYLSRLQRRVAYARRKHVPRHRNVRNITLWVERERNKRRNTSGSRDLQRASGTRNEAPAASVLR